MPEINQSRSLFVVGDDAQSIYSFRGSKVEIILNFTHEYPQAKEIILNQNYRSTQRILNLAEEILGHNQYQKKKQLFTENIEEIEIIHYQATSEKDEAEFIVKRLYELYVAPKTQSEEPRQPTETLELELEVEMNEFYNQPKEPPSSSHTSNPVSKMFDLYLEPDNLGAPSPLSQPVSWSSWTIPEYSWSDVEALNECVVLYRTHSQSRALEEVFVKYRLPYRLVGGIKFLERKEIKDLVAMLRWLQNRQDKLSLSRFLPLLIDGLGPKTLNKVLTFLEDSSFPLAPKLKQQLEDKLATIDSVLVTSHSLVELIDKLVVVSGYRDYLQQEYGRTPELEARLENLKELASIAREIDQQQTGDLKTKLQAFLEQLALQSSQEATDEASNIPKITLMTLHQSKGLEFETVFLVGVEDNLLPHQNSLFNPEQFAEEVRLAYVGVTRAKKYLHLISCQSRVYFGEVRSNPVSRIFRPFLHKYCHLRRKFNQ